MSQHAGDRFALALTLLVLAGCGSSGEPSDAVTEIFLEVQSSESEADRDLVVVGEDASASITALTEEGCLSSAPCSTSADVEIRSSNPDVLLPERQHVRAPASVSLTALAPGTATITVTADGLSDSRRVDVTAELLPLDAIQVTLVAAWNDLPVQYDEANSLSSVEIPTSEYAALEIKPLRNGVEVFGVPIVISEFAPNIALTSVNCRAVRHDPQCNVYSDGWILGVTPGDAEITVWARTACDTSDPSCTWTRFTAHVVEQPSPGSMHQPTKLPGAATLILRRTRAVTSSSKDQ